MAQMKEQIKTPEKELSDEGIDNLSNAEFKTLVIRMLTELIELGHKMKEEMKATQSKIKQNLQGTNSEGKETGTQINGVDQKGERNIQPEKNEEKCTNIKWKCWISETDTLHMKTKPWASKGIIKMRNG